MIMFWLELRHVDVCHIINIKACMLVVAYLSLRNVSGRMQYDLSLLDKRVNQIVPFYILNISKSSFLPSPTSTHGSFFLLQSTDFFNDSERIEEFPVYKRSWRKKVLFIILIEKTGQNQDLFKSFPILCIAITQSLKSSRNWRVESGEETCLYKTCREEF